MDKTQRLQTHPTSPHDNRSSIKSVSRLQIERFAKSEQSESFDRNFARSHEKMLSPANNSQWLRRIDNQEPTVSTNDSDITQDTVYRDKSLQTFTSQFIQTAKNKKGFQQVFSTAFGNKLDTRQVENLRQSALDGDFTWLPDIQWMDANKLPNSNLGLSSMRGAYSSENDTVYLSRQLLSEDPTHSARVLTEEIGQAIGQRINNAETPREQGELFSTLIYGDKLTLARIQALKPEHINNAVEVENQQSQVKGNIFSSAFDIIKSEFDRLVDKVKGAFKKLGKYLNDAQDYVTDLLENTVGVIKDAGDLLGNTINAFSEATQDVVNALAEGTSDLVESAIKSLINTGKKFAKNIENALKKLANGDIPGAIANLAKASAQLLLLGPAELAIEGGKQVLDTGIRLLHAACCI